MLLVNTTGNFGDSIFISGSGNSFYKISEVRFGGTSGVSSDFQVLDENLIQATVPSFESLQGTGDKHNWANFCAPDYPIIISETRGVSGLASGANNEVFTPLPKIKDFNPKSSFSGETVYLYGDGFLGITGVKLTGISGDNTAYHTGVGFTGYTGYEEKICEFSGINNTGIEVTLPSGNTRGLFSVYGTGVSGSNPLFFEPDIQIKAFFTGTNFSEATGENLSGLFFYTCDNFIISGLDFSEELMFYGSGLIGGFPETGYVVDFGLSNSMIKKDEIDVNFAIGTGGTDSTGVGTFNVPAGSNLDKHNVVPEKIADVDSPKTLSDTQYTRVPVSGFFQKISNNVLSGSVPTNVNLPEVSLVKNKHVAALNPELAVYSNKQAKVVSNNLGLTAIGGQGNKVAIRNNTYKTYNTGLLRITGSAITETGYSTFGGRTVSGFDTLLSGFAITDHAAGRTGESIVAFGENSIVSYSTDEPIVFFNTGDTYGDQPLNLEGTDFFAAKFGATGDIKTTNPFLVFIPEFNNLTFEDCFDYYATSGFFPSGCEPQVLFYISGGLANGHVDSSGQLIRNFQSAQRYLDITTEVFQPKLLKCFLTSQLLSLGNSSDLAPYTGHTEIEEFCKTYLHTDVTNAVNQPYSPKFGGVSTYYLAESFLREKRVGGGHSNISFLPPPFEVRGLIEPDTIVNFAHTAIEPFTGSGIYFGRPDGSKYPSGEGPTGEFTNESFNTTNTFDGVTTVNRDGRTQKWGISYVNDSLRYFDQPCTGYVDRSATGDLWAYNIININCRPEVPTNQRPPFWHNITPSEYLQKDTNIEKPFNSTSWPNVAVLQSAPAPLFGMPATQKTMQGFMRVSLYPSGRAIEAAAMDSYESNSNFAKAKGNPSQPLFTTPNPQASYLPPQTMRVGQEMTLNTPIGTVVGALSAPNNFPDITIIPSVGTGLNYGTAVTLDDVKIVDAGENEPNDSSNAPILPSEVTTAYPMNSGPFRNSTSITSNVKIFNQTKFKLDI